MADSDAVKKLGEAARSGFKSPKKDPFGEAREGALKAIGEIPPQIPATDLFAQKAPAPSPMPAMVAPSPSPSPMGMDDQFQALSDEQQRMTGRPMSLEEAKAALQRRGQKASPEIYRSIEGQ